VTAADPAGPCADLLAIISLLSAEGVSRDLFHRGESAGVPAGGAAGGPGAGAAEIDEALSRLADASLLTFSGDDGTEPTLTAHRMVMRVTRERRAHDGTLPAVGTKACDLIAAAFQSLGEPWQHRAAARDLVRQVIALNDHLAPHVIGRRAGYGMRSRSTRHLSLGSSGFSPLIIRPQSSFARTSPKPGARLKTRARPSLRAAKRLRDHRRGAGAKGRTHCLRAEM
jgi:hypothetical protein